MGITSDMISVLCILFFVIVMMITHLVPYGVTAMSACALFVLTGIFDVGTAFSGLANPTTILSATMFVIAAALGKTSLMHRLRDKLLAAKGKGDFVILLVLFLLTIVLSQMMGQLPGIMIVLVFIQSVEGSTKISTGRMLFLVCMVSTIWCSKIPIATGATMPIIANSFYQEMVQPQSLLGIWDIFKAGVIPAIAGTIYCIFAHKLLPDHKIDESQVAAPTAVTMCKRSEFVIIGVFLVVTVGFMFSNTLSSDITNLIPIIGVLLLIISKSITVKEALQSLTADLIWMMAGMQIVSMALSKTGVGALIGNTVLDILGSNPSAIMVITVFCIATTIMTNLLSDMGTLALMLPIAVSTAQVAGLNVATIAAVVTVSAWFAIALPTGSTSTMLAYGVGQYNPLETLKFTLPLVIICCISLIISVTIFFPVFA